MKSITAFLLFVTLSATGFAQNTGQPRPVRWMALPDEQPLLIVDSVVSDFSHLLITPDKIQSIDILKDAGAAEYGEKGMKYGVLIIRTKNKDLLSLGQLLDAFQVPAADRGLRVCIDHVLVSEPGKILADKTTIASVEVVTDICWINPAMPGPEERHINIVPRRTAQLLQ